jgi:hypothetical protein
MLRKVIVGLLFLLSPSTLFADESRPPKYVYLNAPGALEKLQKTNPSHYAKIQTIVSGLENRIHGDVPRWIRTTFDAKDVSYSNILLTTSPPQRDLSFMLDGTRYHGRVTLMSSGATIFTIKNQ